MLCLFLNPAAVLANSRVLALYDKLVTSIWKWSTREESSSLRDVSMTSCCVRDFVFHLAIAHEYCHTGNVGNECIEHAANLGVKGLISNHNVHSRWTRPRPDSNRLSRSVDSLEPLLANLKRAMWDLNLQRGGGSFEVPFSSTNHTSYVNLCSGCYPKLSSISHVLCDVKPWVYPWGTSNQRDCSTVLAPSQQPGATRKSASKCPAPPLLVSLSMPSRTASECQSRLRRHAFVKACGPPPASSSHTWDWLCGTTQWELHAQLPSLKKCLYAKFQINSKTNFVSKKHYRTNVTAGPHQISKITDFSCRNDTCRIMVGCRWCTHPSIHTKTCADTEDHGRLTAEHISKHSPVSWCWRSQDHGRLPAVHVSKHSHKQLYTCWTSRSARGKSGAGLQHHESPRNTV